MILHTTDSKGNTEKMYLTNLIQCNRYLQTLDLTSCGIDVFDDNQQTKIGIKPVGQKQISWSN